MSAPGTSESWRLLDQLADSHRHDRIADYFSADSKRFEAMSLKVGGLFLDYSKNRVAPPVMQALIDLARDSDLEHRREQMFSGAAINITEDRPVLHTALRNRSQRPVEVEGQNVMPAVRASLDKIKTFTHQVRDGQWRGHTGKRIRHIVNIGIGGSDLGPNMVCRALLDYQRADLDVHFVSNVDGRHLKKVLRGLDPEATLFVVSTKTFSTQETLLNAQSAKRWLCKNSQCSDQEVGQHFVAVSTNKEAALEFGIREENTFEFWDWVGGRYSLWSSIGLPIALAVGFDAFSELLEGAYDMDRHFVETPFEANMPVILALMGIWNSNFLGAETLAIIPYDQALHQLPAFLQQLDMESNGKSVDLNGNTVEHATGPIVWGQTGSNGQHAFFQLLHQGTRFVPVDFIASLKADEEVAEHHFALLTNMLAQASALMNGDTQENHLSYAGCPGNRPSNVLLLDELSPRNVGALIALYEHKVFVQGVIWNTNSFDQWGVQLGKRLANDISRNIQSNTDNYDASTRGLMGIVNRGLRPETGDSGDLKVGSGT
ncbi:MAG: glucose-6-phosphate isomerase [Oleiphilaceae bacterium]|nr:glucose-6-phosphate isomerase [Oleiphilaceae bacterium]